MMTMDTVGKFEIDNLQDLMGALQKQHIPHFLTTEKRIPVKITIKSTETEEVNLEVSKINAWKDYPMLGFFFLLVARMDPDFGISREAGYQKLQVSMPALFGLYVSWVKKSNFYGTLEKMTARGCVVPVAALSGLVKKKKLESSWQKKSSFTKKDLSDELHIKSYAVMQAFMSLYQIPGDGDTVDGFWYNMQDLVDDGERLCPLPKMARKALNFVDINRERMFEDEFMDDFYWALNDCFPNHYKALKRIGMPEIEIVKVIETQEFKTVFKLLQKRKHLELKEIQYRDAKNTPSTAKFLLKNMDDEMLRKKAMGIDDDPSDDPVNSELPDYLKDDIPESPIKLTSNMEGIHADLGVDRD